MDVRGKDSRYLFRDEKALPVEVTGARGSCIYSGKRRYIDLIMGWNVGNIGWNNDYVLGRMRKFRGPGYVDPYLLYKPWAELAETLARITPGRLRKSFRATGGTEAVEIALQSAMVHTGRTGFVSLGGYHGHSIGAMSVGGPGFRAHWKNLLPGCHRINPPFDADAGRAVEKLLKTEKIAAYISEPIVCNLGVVVPDREFFGIVGDACRSYGTDLIMYEVATGFGRTGRLFASEHYNLKPDIMTLGKAITGGHAGLGATVVTDEIADSMEFDFSTYSTFGWMPLATEAAMANIRYIMKGKLWKKAETMGRWFEEQLRGMQFRHSPKIRAVGLAIGVGFRHRDYALRIVGRALKHGVIMSNTGHDTFTLFPALNIDEKTAEEGLRIISQCV